jgi:signal-transduction protein with cAMP-binding, CBS, and nucleotidyltransferase domain
MTLAEKLFALHAVFPFSRLKPEELLIVATAFSPRRFLPGQVVCPAGEPLGHLYVKIEGDLVDERGQTLQPVVGAPSLLTGQHDRFTMMAGTVGYHALLLPRGKLFTVINECPVLLAGFFQIPMLGIDYGHSATSSP